MIDNISQIRGLLNFESPDTFYFVQILKRRKDNPGLRVDMKVITNIYIDSYKQYDEMMPDIIEQCTINRARAYIRLNRRSYKKTALRTSYKISGHIADGCYVPISTAYDKVAGKFHSETDKTWVVDADSDKISDGDSFKKLMNNIEYLQILSNRTPMTEVVQTPNGKHIICRPFNLLTFKQYYSEIDVHKDNPTILYSI